VHYETTKQSRARLVPSLPRVCPELVEGRGEGRSRGSLIEWLFLED